MAVRTIPAPFRRRSGGRAPSTVAELAVAALTVVSGLQLLRLMVSTMVGVYRDRLGAPLAGLALFAFVVVALGLLAAPVARLLGRPRALVVSVAGVALVRLALQLVPDATARWLLAPVGVMLFCWFVPLWPGWPSTRPWPDSAAAGTTPGRPAAGRSPWPWCWPSPPSGRWPPWAAAPV